MSVRLVSSPNNYQVSSQAKYQRNIKDTISDGSALRVYDLQEEAPAKVKAASFLGALGGIAAAMFITFNRGKNIEGIKEMKGIKDYFHNLSNVVYKHKDKAGKPTYVVEKLIAALTAGSVGGGLLCGAIADKKENLGAKIREGVIQVLGNIATPLLFVVGGLRLFEKYGENKAVNVFK